MKMIARLCMVWSLATVADAQAPKRPMTFDDILGLRSLGAVEIAPDGKSIVYAVNSWEHADVPVRRSHLWLVSGGAPRQLTFGERGESSPKWSPDGRTVAFLSARGASEEGQKPQIWLLPVDGGEARQLTHAPGGAEGFAWSPDGSQVSYLSADSVPQRPHSDAQVFEQGVRFTHLWVTTVATGQTREVAHGPYTLSALAINGVPQWSPDGTRIAFVASSTGLLRDLRGTIYVVTVATAAVQPIGPELRSAPVTLSQPVWSPDGRTLAFPTFPQSDRLQGDSIPLPILGGGSVVLYDVATTHQRVVRDSALIATIAQLQWTPDGKSLLFTSTDRVYQDVFALDVGSGTFRRLTDSWIVRSLSVSRDGSRVAFGLETPTASADVYVSDLKFGAPKRMTTLNPQLADVALGETEVITWQSDGGTQVSGILLRPVGYTAGRRYPLLVEEHGGPTGTSLDDFKASVTSPGQVWAGRGWAVLYPNPRGSEGFGERFMRANINDLGGGDYRDVMAGVDDVIRRGVADSSRMAFIGWSYGGYMTAWVVGHTSRFKAARMGAGMSDLVSMYGTSEISGYIGLFEGGMPSAATLEMYRRQSPLTYADGVTTPLLILHGASDPRVPPGQAIEFYRALRDRGKTTELVLYPREQHGFTEYYHLLDRMQRDSAWITKYTLGSAPIVQ
ncbi:MAG TPA: S9 family peptidase [Gemmatimonadaceae bacterium]|nr:S9 family peptidase [Gemmatimonadaceae bacterium]